MAKSILQDCSSSEKSQNHFGTEARSTILLFQKVGFVVEFFPREFSEKSRGFREGGVILSG